MKKALVVSFVLVFALLLSFASVGMVAAGQPKQSCQDQPLTPGNSSSAPGSAFNTTGVAGSHYAGTQPQNSNNPHSVSQYDVACYQVSSHH